jgi:anti-sigma28 factor (negative regulator of flagellin synthesis)
MSPLCVTITIVGSKETKEMQISDHEIRESLRLLFEGPIGDGSISPVDKDTSSKVMGRLENLPEIRSTVVLALKEAIEEQRYCVSDEEVAEQMIGRFLADSLR